MKSNELRSSLKKKTYKIETPPQKNIANKLEMQSIINDSNFESNILSQINYAQARASNESATEKVTTI